MKYADRAPTENELVIMKLLVNQALSEGAVGLSLGLAYAPGNYAEIEELIELCKETVKFNGFYATHIRDEGNNTIGMIASVSEALEISEKAGIPVQISHIKFFGNPEGNPALEVCMMIEDAQSRGVFVMADQYPYNASSTSLKATTTIRYLLNPPRIQLLLHLDNL